MTYIFRLWFSTFWKPKQRVSASRNQTQNCLRPHPTRWKITLPLFWRWNQRFILCICVYTPLDPVCWRLLPNRSWEGKSSSSSLQASHLLDLGPQPFPNVLLHKNEPGDRKKARLIKSHAKCRYLKKFTWDRIFNLLRSPGMDSQPGGPVRQPDLSYKPSSLLYTL